MIFTRAKRRDAKFFAFTDRLFARKDVENEKEEEERKKNSSGTSVIVTYAAGRCVETSTMDAKNGRYLLERVNVDGDEVKKKRQRRRIK